MMSVAADHHSKHYSYNKSQFDCNNSLSNNCPNVLRENNSRSQSDSDSLGRPFPRSMRTFHSRFDEGVGKAKAVESRAFSGPIDKNLQAEGWFSGEGETDKNKNNGFLALDNSCCFPMRLSNVSSGTISSAPPVFPPKETASQAKWIGRFVKSRHLEEHGQNRSAWNVTPLLKTIATSGTLETENLEIIYISLVEDLESTSTELQRKAVA